MWEDNLAPRKHKMAESMSEEAILLRIIFIVELYEEEYFSEIKEANLLYMMGAEGPPATSRRQDHGGECAVFHFQHSSLILPSFFLSCLL